MEDIEKKLRKHGSMATALGRGTQGVLEIQREAPSWTGVETEMEIKDQTQDL